MIVFCTVNGFQGCRFRFAFAIFFDIELRESGAGEPPRPHPKTPAGTVTTCTRLNSRH